MRVIGLAGWSGAGKTTLLLKLIPALARRGLSVSTLKHAHHAFDIDRPGKDSFEHRAAGAREVLISSGLRWALMHENRDDDEAALPDLLRKLAPVDLVVIEGFKSWSHPKIEVHRLANGKPLMAGELTNNRAVATDAEGIRSAGPVVPLDDVEAIADLVLAIAEPLETLLPTLSEGERLREPGPSRRRRAAE